MIAYTTAQVQEAGPDAPIPHPFQYIEEEGVLLSLLRINPRYTWATFDISLRHVERMLLDKGFNECWWVFSRVNDEGEAK